MAATLHKSNMMDQLSSDLNPDWLDSEVKTGVSNNLIPPLHNNKLESIDFPSFFSIRDFDEKTR